MKLTIPRETLLPALERANRIAERRSTIPILLNLRLTAGAGGLAITATDLDIEVAAHVPADVATPGDVTAPAAALYDIARKMPADAECRLEMDGERLRLAAGRARFALPTLPASDFPDITAGEMAAGFTVDGAAVADLIAATRFAISTEETRYYLNGIYLHPFMSEGAPPQLRAVATDGRRLSRRDVALPDGAADMPGVIVPRKAVEEIGKLAEAAAKAGDALQIGVTPTKIRVTAGGTSLTSKLIDGTFPDYQRVIPKANDKRVVIERADLASAIAQVMTVASERGRAVKCSLTEGKLKLTVTDGAGGEAVVEIDADYDGQPIEIGFNGRYLTDVLEALGGDTIRISLSDPGAPAILDRRAGDEHLTVLMPMRV